MKQLTALLAEFQSLDIQVWVDADQLRYRAPKGRMTADLLGRLRDSKDDLIDFLAGGGASAPIVPAPAGAPAVLSFAQERLWFLDRLAGGSANYNLSFAMRLQGALDVDALQATLSAIVDRHEVLRTRFGEHDGSAVLAVDPPGGFRLLRERAEVVSDTAAELAALVEREAAHVFDLAAAPPFRARLIELGADDHLLVVNLHHILGDGWSLGLFAREFGREFAARSQGRQHPAPALPVQYRDYAHWQRHEIGERILARQLDFWRNELQDAPPLLNLPLDFQRPAVQGSRGAAVPVHVPADVADRLRLLALEEGATPFMVLLAAFQLLLARLCEQTDVVVGSPVAGRNRPELQELIGLFVNTLALRAEVRPEHSFRRLLAAVRKSTLAAQANQDLPFEQIVDALRPVRSLSHSPIFQVMFLLGKGVSETPAQWPGMTVSQVRREVQTTKFDLTLNLNENGAAFDGVLEYGTELFRPETVARFALLYQRVLAAVAADADQPTGRIALLDEAEREQLLRGCNATRRDYRETRCLHEIVRAHALAAPHAIAAVDLRGQTSYAALERRANALAARLQAQGVGPECRVGVFLQRSEALLVALLGVLKAGAAYVPLDPQYPAERIGYILGDCGAALLLTESALRPRLPQTGLPVVEVDTLSDSADTAWRDVAVDPGNLAYMIYTSGSTGRPKGVMIPHGGLMNYLNWAAEAYAPAAGSGSPVHSSISFDATITSLFLPLMAGSRCILVDDRDELEGLGNAMADDGHFSLAKITPAHLEVLRHNPVLAAGSEQPLRFVIGGEALPGTVIRQWRGLMPNAVFVNEYGPTETVVGCSIYSVTPGSPDFAGAVPIGRPIANTELYVLDTLMQPVPLGVGGELYIGGAGVARGYHARPDLTAEKFLPDPFAADPGRRLYRTGDRVRRLADGELEFLERIDSQVKIRGFRIETGEIQAVLEECDGVGQALVLAPRLGHGERELVAWLVPAPGAPPRPEALRAALRARLPDYMVPARIRVLDAFPLTANGKIDQAALPQSDDADAATQREPAGETEIALHAIWCELLGRERVGTQQSFFELGGHSLLAIRVVSRIKDRLGVVLAVRDLFAHPTLAELALHVDAQRPRHASLPTVARNAPLALTAAQRSAWQLEISGQALPDHALALALGRRADLPALARVLGLLLERHETLRTRLVCRGDEALVAVEASRRLPLALIDTAGLPPALAAESAARAQAALFAARLSCEAPLQLRAVLLRGAAADDSLVLSVTAFAFDAASLQDFAGQLAAGLARGASALPPAGPAYLDQAYWQRRDDESAAALQAVAELRAQLAVQDLTGAAGDGALPRLAGRRHRLKLDAAQSLVLETQATAYGVKVDAVLAAAIAAAWLRDPAQPRGVAVARRPATAPGIGASGPYAALLPLSLPAAAFAAADPLQQAALVDTQWQALEREPAVALDRAAAALQRDGLDLAGQWLALRVSDWRQAELHLAALQLAPPPLPFDVQADILRSADGLCLELTDSADGAFGAAGLTVLGELLAALVGSAGEVETYTFDCGTRPDADLADIDAASLVALERWLQAQWRELLPSGRLRADGNLAGAGLAAQTRLHLRVREQLGLHLDLHALAAAGNIPAQARCILAAGLARPAAPNPDADPADAPLSPAQQRLWFLDASAGGAGEQLVPRVHAVDGELDPVALAERLRRLVARHPALRTVIDTSGETPRQRVLATAPAIVGIVDLAALGSGAAAQADAVLAQLRDAGYDLQQAPLARVALLRLGAQRQRLYLHAHALIADAAALDALVTSLGEDAPVIAATPAPAEIARWQQQQVRSERWTRSFAFWRAELADLPPLLELPADRPRPAQRRYRGGRVQFRIAADRCAALARVAAASGLETALLAAMQVWLARYAGEWDFAVGLRSGAATPRIAHQAATLALRADAQPSLSFAALLARVAQRRARIAAQAELPFELLLERLLPQRSLSHAPLFQVGFEAVLEPPTLPRWPHASVRALDTGDDGRSRLDLELRLQAEGEALAGELRYDSDLFDAATMQGWIDNYLRLLEVLAEAPQQPLGELDWLADSERAAALESAQGAALTATADSLVELIAAQVARTPAATALIDGETRIDYASLWQRVETMAAALQQRGVRGEDRVAVCLERRSELLVSLLAVLRLGAAYVPLDPKYPPDRLAYIAEDAQAVAVITRAELGDRLPAGLVQWPVETLTTAEPLVSPPIAAEQLAYLIYTSGSTGRPKGVAITHGNAATFALWAQTVFSADDLAGTLAATSMCFDLSVFEFFVPLTVGGTVILAEDALALPRLAAREAVTLVNTVPSALAALLGENGIPSGVRVINLAGEALSRELAEAIHAQCAVRLYNLYGPSEDTTYSTFTQVPAGAAKPLIGLPIAGTQAYVLDAQGQALPPGAVGELYLGGAGLARGYLGRPDLTAERFLPNPFAVVPGERLYRTGDRVRRLRTGELDYLGRTDHQVKLRGFRIELGEIEARLREHEAVQTAVVVVREDRAGDPRLVAYAATDADAETLRAHLAAQLPAYMVPAVIVVLDALPLNANGKIDRKALPAPDYAAAADDYVAPRNAIEADLVQIWQELLGLERVGIHDSFFALGGHSLLAMRAVARIRERLLKNVPVLTLFNRPSVAGIAACLDGAAGDSALPLVRLPRHAPLRLSLAQERLWFLSRMDPQGASYNMAYAAALDASVTPARLERALATLAQRHEVFRCAIREVDGVPLQVSAAPAALAVIDCDRSEFDRRAQALAARPFVLEQGELLRPALLRAPDGGQRLILVMHHIIADGWSVELLADELSCLLDDDGAPLAPLPLQYADYAHWQRQYLHPARVEQQLGYWRGRLAGLPPLLDLPTDRPRPAVQRHEGARLRFRIDAHCVARLDALARRHDATVFMALLGAFELLLARYSGQADFAVGVPVANRPHADLERIVGFFVNTLVLRSEVDTTQDFPTLLGRVRDGLVEGLAHQDVLDQLVSALNPERSLAYNPLFQVLFNLVNLAEAATAGAARLDLQPIGVDAKFDLSLTLREDADGLGAELEYRSDLFDAATMQGWADNYLRLLEVLAEAPQQPLGELDWLADSERAAALESAQGAALTATADSLVELIAAQVARTPAATALIDGETRIDYASLWQRVETMAAALQQRGVRGEDRVAVCLERRSELLVSLLAVLRLGAAYVPLDPKYPPDRLAYIAEDAQAVAVITRAELGDRLPAGLVQWPVETLTTAEPLVSPPIAAEQLAYLIYTSGSTGRPKGVAITHGNAATFALWAQTVFSADDLAGTLAATSMCFDLSVFEFFVPLTVGGTVILAEDALALPRLAAREAVTLVNTVPSALAALLGENGIPSGVRVINLAGEALSRELAEAIHAQCAVRLYNLYGPSEDTTYSTFTQVPAGAAKPLIGLPIAGTQAYVLDAQGQALPPGAVGELYLGGAGLARGYLGRPDLTAERFLPNPFAVVPGERLYRTGDRVRRLRTGELDYLGRTDHQVKLRGFRIELGEIEARLREHEAVQTAVVVVREDRAGDPRLVAYAATDADAETLRAHLAAQLPAYMVPAAIVVLDALPLNANGKIDRKALPAPDYAAAADSYAAPRSREEWLLAETWQTLLGVERVGIHDSFFALGGHSLLVMQLVARVRSLFGVELPVASLFEAPTIARLAPLLSLAAGSETPALVALPDDKPAPQSFSQSRLWFLDQIGGPSPIYNMPFAQRLEGELDFGVLTRTLQALVDRHPSFRTRFAMVDGEPMQIVEPALRFALPLVDLSPLDRDPAAKAEQVRRLSSTAARYAFDLGRAPLLFVLVLRLAPAEHVLCFNMHHIVSDGWSLQLMIREFAQLYAAFAEGEPSPLAPLAYKYTDFAHWQQECLRRGLIERQLDYWRDRLAGLPPLLELPTDKPRPPEQSHRGATLMFMLDAAQVQRFTALGQRRGATLFMTMLASFELLLARYSGQTDFAVGSPLASRTHSEIESIIGFFVNTLVLRADVDESASFLQMLERVKQTTLDAYNHQDIPFERLIAELVPERTLAWQPLFQVMFMLASGNTGELDIEWPGMRMTPVGRQTGVAKFDLTLSMVETAEGALRCAFEYSSDLFEADSIARLRDNYLALLHCLLEAPEQPLCELELLAAPQRAALAIAAQGPALATDAVDVVARIEACMRERPDAIALVDGERQLSYGALDRASAALATNLRAAGIGAESRVALCLERSIEQLVGVLGILRADACYVPLDPALPDSRLHYILADSAAAALVVADALAPRFAAADLPRFGVAATAPACAAAPRRVGEAARLAYVIYTSGSTGRPKGVGIPQAALANFVAAAAAPYGHGAGDRVLQFASLGFDASAEEIYPCLANGGTLVLRDEAMLSSAPAFIERCADQQLGIVDLPTAFWHQLCADLVLHSLAVPDCVRLIILGGEAVLPEALQQWRTQVRSRARLLNTYGPTESTIVASWHAFDLAATAAPVAQNIGRPLANLSCHVLDRDGRLVPSGAAGELCIGGAGLARGYLERPDLTAERFVPDPFSGRPGARLYRSGDRVRRLPDGELEFLGRIDDQIKIRGFRIELGEVERVIADCADIAEVSVQLHEPAPGDKRLVAYLVSRSGAPDLGRLRAEIGTVLPAYMLPSAFVVLAAMPLNANGKIDRRALPAPDYAAAAQAYEAPSTAEQRLLAEIWQELLGLPRIGIHDSFFALGGHSLLAARAMARLRSRSGMELPIRLLFEQPTIAALSPHLRAAAAVGGNSDEPSLRARAIQARYPLSYAQQRLWFLYRLEGPGSAYNMPVATELNGEFELGLLRRALSLLVERQAVYRTRFVESDGEAWQIVDAPAPLALPLIDLAGLPADCAAGEARRLAAADAARAFVLEQGSLLRASVLRLAAQRHVLLLNQHHIISDGWSVRLFSAELGRIVAALAARRAPELPPLPVQYTDYALWQREWLSGERLERQVAFWRAELADLPPVLELPTDKARPAQRRYRSGQVQVALDAELRRAVEAISRTQGVTPFMTLLASVQVLLARYSGQWDFALGTPVAGRGRSEVESLIGFFANTVVLRSDAQPERSFAQLLQAVKARALSAYEHQDLPFEQLVDRLNPERSLSHSPLFQVLFLAELGETARNAVTDENAIQARALADTTATRQAKFDLSIAVVGSGDGLAVSLEYDTDLFEPSTMQAWAGNYAQLLRSLVGMPERAVGEVEWLAEHERVAALETGQGAALTTSADSLVELIAAQVARTPAATALIDGETRIDYASLWQRVETMAAALQQRGVRGEDRVAVCLERRSELLVSLLAVLRLGAAYVPLDPKYPPDRLAYIAEDAQAVAVITRAELGDRLPAGLVQWPVETLTTAEPLVSPPIAAEQLAYLIYTSGSTGRPKGVAITHGNAATFALWAQTVFSADDLAGTLAATSMCFDLSVFEFFVPLTVGGTVILAEDALALPRLAAREAVTLVNTVPSALAALLGENGIPSGVRVINLAGEALSRELAEAIHAQCAVRLYNLYGPSEDTTYSTFTQVPAGAAKPLIGLPIAGTQAYVLDAQGQALPPGAVGELYLGGAGLARGYLGRPDLTAERFLPNPFAVVPGERLYRTGDRVRRLRTGELDYLGRTDHQVKLRGFRIELGEIEARLREHEAVQTAVVVVREDRAGDPRLVAYAATDADAETLRAHLAAQLPAYMVPAAIVVLDALPLNANGKIDRKALPAPEGLGGDEAGYVAPSTREEVLLAELWQDLLGVERVGVTDNFFALGGHSLLAMRLIARIERETGVSLRAAQLFQTPVLGQLAAQLAAPDREHGAQRLVLLRAGDAALPAFYCVPGLGGSAADFTALANALPAGAAVYAFQPRGLEIGELPSESIEAMARDYLQALDEIQPGTFRGQLLGHSMGGLVALEMALRLGRRGRTPMLWLLDTQPPRQGLALQAQPDEADALALYVERHGKGLLLDAAQIRAIPAPRRIAEVLRRIEGRGGDAPEQVALAQRIVQLYRAHLCALQGYRSRVRFEGRVVYFVAAARRRDRRQSPVEGWNGTLAQSPELYVVAGDHLGMLQAPHVASLAASLTLAQAAPAGLPATLEAQLAVEPEGASAALVELAREDRGLRGYRERNAVAAFIAAELQRRGLRRVLDVGAATDNARLPPALSQELRITRDPALRSLLRGDSAAPPVSMNDAVLALGNDAAYATREQFVRLLLHCRAALRPGGLLIGEALGRGALLAGESGGLRVEAGDGRGSARVWLQTLQIETSRLLRGVARVDAAGVPAPLQRAALQAYDAQELAELLSAAGFRGVSVFGGAGKTPAAEDAVLLFLAENPL